MFELSLTDLLLASLLPMLAASATAVAGRLLAAAGRKTSWPATGFAVASQTLERRGCPGIPVGCLGKRGDDHWERRSGSLCLRADVFHGRNGWSAVAAAYAAVWAVDVAGRRFLGGIDQATASLLLFGGPAAGLGVLVGFIASLKPLLFAGAVALVALWLLDLAWAPWRFRTALRTVTELKTSADAGADPSRWLPRAAWGQVLQESSRLVSPPLWVR
mgnify:CR=1 FL=1